MAVWQFHLIVIPKKGVIKKYGNVPDTFRAFVDTDGFRKYAIPTKDSMEEGAFSAPNCWNLIEIEPTEIIQQIDKYVKRCKDYDDSDDLYVSWKTHVRNVIDNDADLIVNKQTGKIEELSFRADLRDKSLTFLKQMIELAKRYDWLFLDAKGNIANPNMNEVGHLIKISNPFRFLQNPEQFFTDLQDGSLKIE